MGGLSVVKYKSLSPPSTSHQRPSTATSSYKLSAPLKMKEKWIYGLKTYVGGTVPSSHFQPALFLGNLYWTGVFSFPEKNIHQIFPILFVFIAKIKLLAVAILSLIRRGNSIFLPKRMYKCMFIKTDSSKRIFMDKFSFRRNFVSTICDLQNNLYHHSG